ncbi:hypothetical protein GCM10011529_21400 [Polymorphobacter glacialis]|uniref:Copper chaperone PCu(A)C n=1 Tax=Sandarakinorhabdus glacialis TaxID=1614636 RepID=A0A916ZWD4_9SPHN|nr:copper chaperone PCu(A)C [Polymorphobacter glacialis]GGE14727.1 hypothetical protein GCM10011529_21400 [Polymorphobacter glacialis]
MIRSLFAMMLMAMPIVAVAAVAPAKPAPVEEAWDRTKPRVEGAWVRLAAVPGRPSAGYLGLTGGGQPDRLTGVTAPGARIEMHSMSMANGVMKMARLEGVPIPAGGKVAFAQGGNHLMIFGLAGTPKTLPLTLQFASGAKVTVNAAVQAAGSEAPKPGDHGAH